METKLSLISTLGQKDKGPAFIALIPEILSQPGISSAQDLHALVDTVINQDSVGLVVGRQVLSELVKILGEGAIKDVELRKRVVEDTLATVQPRIVSYEEQASPHVPARRTLNDINIQVNSLRFQLADLLEEEEEWSDAARVLMGISLDSGQRWAFRPRRCRWR
jgi:COP9 signalosome complex subunit 4